jgi:hypothetical protein
MANGCYLLAVPMEHTYNKWSHTMIRSNLRKLMASAGLAIIATTMIGVTLDSASAATAANLKPAASQTQSVNLRDFSDYSALAQQPTTMNERDSMSEDSRIQVPVVGGGLAWENIDTPAYTD